MSLLRLKLMDQEDQTKMQNIRHVYKNIESIKKKRQTVDPGDLTCS